LSGVAQIAVGPNVACVARREGTAMCWGGALGGGVREELAGVHDAEEVATSGIVRCVRSRPIDRGGSGEVRCSPHPSPTQGMSAPKSVSSEDARWTFAARDAVAVIVDWGTVCIVRNGGDVECSGYDSSGPIARRTLSDLDGSDAVSLVYQSIGCGIDRQGGVVTKSSAVGFCGENTVVSDGRGIDPSHGGGSSYSADLAPRLRLGASILSGMGQTDGAFATGFHLSYLFGTGLRTGPFVDVGTRGFSTFDASTGWSVLAGSSLLFGLDAGVGHAFAHGAEDRSYGMITGSVGYGVRLQDARCDSGCGTRYLSGAGIDVSVRRSLTAGQPDEIVVLFSVDPVILALPFALFGARWSFD
jgi:hypothetical protein